MTNKILTREDIMRQANEANPEAAEGLKETDHPLARDMERASKLVTSLSKTAALSTTMGIVPPAVKELTRAREAMMGGFYEQLWLGQEQLRRMMLPSEALLQAAQSPLRAAMDSLMKGVVAPQPLFTNRDVAE